MAGRIALAQDFSKRPGLGGQALIVDMVLIIVAAAAAFIIVMGFAVQGPPFVASDDDSAAGMLELVKRSKPRRVLDIGSGNGKLVILLAGQGYMTDGVEINPWLVWRAGRRIKRSGLQDKAAIHWGNFWTYDVAGYDVVTLYAAAHVMPRLEKKLKAELRPGSRIISNYFVFPNLKPAGSAGQAREYNIQSVSPRA